MNARWYQRLGWKKPDGEDLPPEEIAELEEMIRVDDERIRVWREKERAEKEERERQEAARQAEAVALEERRQLILSGKIIVYLPNGVELPVPVTELLGMRATDNQGERVYYGPSEDLTFDRGVG